MFHERRRNKCYVSKGGSSEIGNNTPVTFFRCFNLAGPVFNINSSKGCKFFEIVIHVQCGFIERLLPDKRIKKIAGGWHTGGRLHRHILSLIHISEPTRRTPISYAVFCLKKKKKR